MDKGEGYGYMEWRMDMFRWLNGLLDGLLGVCLDLRLYVCIPDYMYACRYVPVCVHVCMHMHILYTYVSLTYLCMYLCMHACVYGCTDGRVNGWMDGQEPLPTATVPRKI